MTEDKPQGQSAFVQAYFALVDASGLTDEEFERQVEEAATASLERNDKSSEVSSA